MSGLWKSQEISHFEGEEFPMKAPARLFRRSGITKPTVWIGKEGVTEPVLDQIRTQLKVKGLVKAKIQKTGLSSASVKEVAEKVAGETSAKLVDARGRTFTLYKKASRT
jgi:RNA-binding protein